MPNLGPTELIIIAVVFVLLFGASKLPDAARSIGRSMRIFKSEVKEMSRDDEVEEQRAISQPPVAQPLQQPVQPVQPTVQQPPVQAPVDHPQQQQQQ